MSKPIASTVTAADINTPLTWLAWVRAQAQESPAEIATRKALDFPMVAAMAILVMAGYGPRETPNIGEIGDAAKYPISNATMTGLIRRGLVTEIFADVRRYRIAPLGVIEAKRIEDVLTALIARALRPRI